MRVEWRDDEGSGVEVVRQAAQIDLLLPPGARARVWAGIERRRARLPWRLALPMFLAGAATAAAILLFALPRQERALVLSADGSRHSIRAGDSLPGSTGLSLIDLHAAGRAVAGAGAQARLDRFESGAVELSVDRGTLLIHVNPRKSENPFVVRTPRFVARVVGTVLRIAVGDDGRASIVVGHGAVEVTPNGGASLTVHTGERWPADALDVPSAAELDRLGPADLEGADSASFAPRANANANANVNATSGAADRARAENALYQAGWDRMKAGQTRSALASWQELRRRYPQGILSSEAEASIIDALVALHEDSRARAEVDAYLLRTPDGLRSSEMHFVRGTLLYAADHGCRRAAPEFDRALARPAEPWAQKARAARATCRKRYSGLRSD